MRPIDADALIEKCGDWYVEEGTESGFIGTLENLLATEPTIQPQSTAGQLNDSAQSTNLIDRQQAIDAVRASYDEILDFKSTGRTVADSVEDIISELPSAQPEPQEGHWIPHEGIDGDILQYECSLCGVLWEFNDGTPEDNEAYFCPKCGTKMKGERQK